MYSPPCLEHPSFPPTPTQLVDSTYPFRYHLKWHIFQEVFTDFFGLHEIPTVDWVL